MNVATDNLCVICETYPAIAIGPYGPEDACLCAHCAGGVTVGKEWRRRRRERLLGAIGRMAFVAAVIFLASLAIAAIAGRGV